MTSMHSRMVRSFSTSSLDRIRVMGGAPGRGAYDSRPVVIGPVNAQGVACRSGAGRSSCLRHGDDTLASPADQYQLRGAAGPHPRQIEVDELFDETTRTLER